MENLRKLALYLVLAFAGIGGLITVNQTLADHSGLFGFFASILEWQYQ
jgi:hypothetical protein